MFCLNNNIYIVNGKRRACIYDLNHSDLYSIPLELASVLQDISSYGELPDSLLKTSTFQTLLQQEILVRAEEEKLPLISCSAPKIELATFEITQKCNFRCIHCFEKDKSYKDVPLETARRSDSIFLNRLEFLNLSIILKRYFPPTFATDAGAGPITLIGRSE